MSRLANVVAVAMILGGTMIYIVVIGGAIEELWAILSNMKAVTNGPWWELAKTYKFVATWVIPGVLIASGILVWIVGQVRKEANRNPVARQRL